MDHRDARRHGVGGLVPGERAAAKDDRALVGRRHAEEDLHQGALARAVLAEQAEDLSRPHFEIDAVIGAHGAKATDNSSHFQKRGHERSFHAPFCNGRREGPKPPGRNSRARRWRSPTAGPKGLAVNFDAVRFDVQEPASAPKKTTNSLALIFFITFNLVLARATKEIIRRRSPNQERGGALTTRPRHGLRSRYRRFPRLIRIRLDASPFNENDDKSALRPERRDERLTALVPPAPPRGGARG